MTKAPTPPDRFDELEPALSPATLGLLALGVFIGVFSAVVVLPAWWPGLTASLLGTEPKAFWYLSRASAVVAYGLMWLSMVFGLTITNRLARVWPGGPTAFDLHQHASLLGLIFALFHALILLGDHYINFTWVSVLVPFAASSYRPLWVGLGQVSFYVSLLVFMSFYVRKQIGQAAWRVLHYTSFALFVLTLVHGVVSGTDSTALWMRGVYWLTGGSVLFLTVYRVIVAKVGIQKVVLAKR